ncbi:hypothetical protein BZG36_02578 [Bifiguratus adelaidae]|uniref:Inosine triphosphate pyrophosphatase n=1 Tax=Bifiguratus adelaidae TaxID=1938954 RepID=A0A261Y136_9FUNG|nr:hypothetical protein BZG36_02578 [Bifiguratus adelaidae]
MVKILLTVVALSIAAVHADNLSPGGTATRYWDCCKPSGGISGKAAVNRPVFSCAQDGVTHVDPSTNSACAGGTAYTCTNYQPFVSSCNPNLSYAFGARAQSNDESTFECACYQVTFAQLPGKTLIVQATNDGGDVPATNFDIQIPGGGVGLFDACTAEYNAPPGGWGAQYGGISSQTQCSQLPASLQKGCNWRFTWFADNPTISSISRVKCPSQLTDLSGCIRNDDASQPAPSVGCNGPQPSTSNMSTSTSKASSTPKPTATCAALYAQCGGQGYTGPTCCISSTCQYQNPSEFADKDLVLDTFAFMLRFTSTLGHSTMFVCRRTCHPQSGLFQGSSGTISPRARLVTGGLFVRQGRFLSTLRPDNPQDKTSSTPSSHPDSHSHSHSHGHAHGHEGHSHAHLVDALETTSSRGWRITVVGLVANVGLCVTKGVAGWVMNSASLVADAAHSLSDMISDFVTLYTYRVSRRPPDELHPYGYGKYETVGSLAVSSILIVGALGIGYHSYELLLQVLPETFTGALNSNALPDAAVASAPTSHASVDAGIAAAKEAHEGASLSNLLPFHSHAHEHHDTLLNPNAAWFALASVIIKEWLYQATIKVGKDERSDVLIANAWHHRSDAFSSIVALAAIAGSHFGVPILDPLGGILVSGMILKTGVEIMLGSLKELVDANVDDDVLQQVQQAITRLQKTQPDLIDFHSIRGRKAGPFILVDLILQVNPTLTVEKAHRVEDAVRRARSNLRIDNYRESMGKHQLVFVTGNKNKLAEVQAILGDTVDLVNRSLDLPEIQGTPEEVARAKCIAAAEQDHVSPKIPVSALTLFKGYPVHTWHEGLNKLLAGYEDKSAYALCIFALSKGPGEVPILFEGRTDGRIVPARGPNNFGWDPIFEPTGFDETYAEMPKSTKNTISHRFRALEKLSAYLSHYPPQ